MASKRIRSKLLLSTIFLGIRIAYPTQLYANTFTWDGGGGDLSWNNPANWDPEFVPGAGDDVFFATAGNGAIIDLPGVTVGSIQFGFDGRFNITANDGASLTIASGVGVTNIGKYSISAPIVLAADTNWSTLLGTGLSVSGVISGAGGLAKSGSGALTLTALNDFTGITSINGGTLVIDSVADSGVASSIGAGGDEGTSTNPLATYLALNGGVLRFLGSGHQTNRTFTLGNQGATIDSSGTGALRFMNWQIVRPDGTTGERNLTLAGNNADNNTLGLVLTDLDGGATSLTKRGAGRWLIPSSVPNQPSDQLFVNYYTGPTTITGGVLEVQAEHLAAGLSGGLANGNAPSAIGASDSSAENLLIDGGTLRYDFLGPRDPSLGNPAIPSDWLAHDAGQINRRFTIGAGGGTLDVSGNGPVNWYANGPLALAGDGARTITLTGSFADPIDGTNQYNAISANIPDATTGATSLTKDGAGEWVLTGVNAYSGPTTINDGTLLLAHAYDEFGTFTFQNVINPNSPVSIGPTGTLELYTGDSGIGRNGGDHVFEPLTQTLHSVSGSGRIDLNAGTLIIDNATAVVFDGSITENGDGGPSIHQTGGRLIKRGIGMLTLPGTLNYTGGTAVRQGALVVSRLSDGLTSNGPLEITAAAGVASSLSVTQKLVPNDVSGTSIVSSLAITSDGSSSASLDLANNSLVVDYTGQVGSLEADVRGHLQSGRMFTNITSYLGRGTRLGYADNAALLLEEFSGVSVDATSVLIKFTFSGDSNLDGAVNIADFNMLANNFGATNAFWDDGDFNYDGLVNTTDFGLLVGNFGATGLSGSDDELASLYQSMLEYPEIYWQSVASTELWSRFSALDLMSLGSPPPVPTGLPATVPEPSSLGIMVGAAALMVRRRRGAWY